MDRRGASTKAAADPSRGPGRPRSERSRKAVLDAAYAILVERGLGSFSVDAVAVRARVARTTVYRWWPSKGALAIESFLHGFRPLLVIEWTSSAAADLSTLLHSLARALDGPAGHVAASVIAQMQSDTEIRDVFIREVAGPLRRESFDLVRCGVVRGELRADLDVDALLDGAIGAVYFQLLLGRRLSADWVTRLVAVLMDGSRA